MIVVRNVFQLHFGKTRDAVALWKEAAQIARRADTAHREFRILTDVVGPAYTLVIETTYASLADFETSVQAMMANPEWRAWYPKFLPLAQSSRREIFTVVE